MSRVDAWGRKDQRPAGVVVTPEDRLCPVPGYIATLSTDEGRDAVAFVGALLMHSGSPGSVQAELAYVDTLRSVRVAA